MFRWRLPIFACFAAITIAATTYFQEIEDSYRWLEDNANPQTVEWLADQHAKCETYFAESPDRMRISDQLSNIMNMDIAILPQAHGELTFFMARFKGQQQPSLCAIDDNKSIQTIVDAETLSTDGTISICDYVLQKDNSLVAYGTKKNGSDEEVWYIKDFRTGEMLSDKLSKIKFSPPIWDNDGKGLYYFCFEENNRQALYHHAIGTLETKDQLLYKSQKDAGFSFGLAICNEQYLKFNVRKGSSSSNSIVFASFTKSTDNEDLARDSLALLELFYDADASYNYVGSKANRFYFVTNKDASRGKIISIDSDNLNEEPREELAESNGIIQQACFVKDQLVINYLTNGCSELKVLDNQGNVSIVKLPGTGTATLAKAPLDENDDIFYFTYVDFVHPPSLYLCQSSTQNATLFMAPTMSWNPDDYEMHQLSYPSTDGTYVPLFIVHKKGLQLDHSNRTLLYAYGGFNITVSPSFSVANIVWLESGGVYAIASIRGGGELGEEWHRAGMLHNKQQSFDDFMAGAKFLCDQGYTQKSKLAVHGVSNGGLLVGACLTQNQDLFKAAIAEVGVFDMLRFHLFTIGWAWTAEYGSPDNPEDSLMLRKYSPYHSVQNGKEYPSTLITTSDHDDRVVPLHSYKFAAALQQAQAGPNPIVLRVHYNTGHGAGKTQRQIIDEATERLMFLYKELE